MKLPQPLFKGILLRRYKRFLADVRLENGEVVTAHCPNSGSMKGCQEPGSAVLLSRRDNPRRKLPYTWELVKADGVWVGINTQYPNRLVREAIEQGVVPELSGYRRIRNEVNYGRGSRVDLLLEGEQGLCYVEVKNVTLVESGRALFPDAVTLRGQKHLRELMEMVSQGHRAVIFFVVQRADGHILSPADEIDPVYGKLLREAVAHGVEALAYQARVTPREVVLSHRIPVVLEPEGVRTTSV